LKNGCLDFTTDDLTADEFTAEYIVACGNGEALRLGAELNRVFISRTCREFFWRELANARERREAP